MHFGIKKPFFLLSAFVLLWLTVRLLLPLLFPFVLGLILALAAEPLVGLLTRRLHLPRGLGSGLGISATFFLISILLLMLCAFLIRQLQCLSGYLPGLEQTFRSGSAQLQAWLLNLTSHVPGGAGPLVQDHIRSFFADSAALMQRSTRYALGLAGNLLSHVPDSALTLGTTVLAGYMISAKLPKIRFWLRTCFSAERLQAFLAAFRRVRHAALGWLVAQCKLMGVTFCLLFAGFLILRISGALYWALGVSLVDAFPVLGTGTVLLPWALLAFLRGDIPRTLGLLGIYTTVSLIRSALEPKLLGRQLGLDPLVTLMTLYVGFRLWGLGGMLLAPLLLVTVLQILPDRSRKYP